MKHWTRFLRDCKERDLRCVSVSETAAWSKRLSKIWEFSKSQVWDVEIAIEDDGDEMWKAVVFQPTSHA